MTNTAPASRLLVLVPTRNRADLAIAAVESVRCVAPDRVRVLVSDNSNVDAQAAELATALERLGDERITYVRPPEPLAMGAHWEWGLAQALQLSDCTHVTVLTDRMLFLPGAIDDLLALTDEWGGEVISYNLDRVQDAETPVRLEQADWTGRVIEIPSSAMLDASASCIFVAALPRLLNNVVPRGVLEDVQRQFGAVCDSVSPDFRFAFRVLAARPSIVYYDRSLLLQYALRRSNGFSHSRGVRTEDSKDFDAQLSQEGARFATPLVDVCTVVNGIVHEYCSVRAEAPEAGLAPLDVNAFFGAMTREIDAMVPGEIQTALREEIERVMAERSARADPLTMAGGPESFVRRLTRTVSRAGRRDDAIGATIRLLTGWLRRRYVLRETEWPSLADAIQRAQTAPRSARWGKAKHEIVLRDVKMIGERIT